MKLVARQAATRRRSRSRPGLAPGDRVSRSDRSRRREGVAIAARRRSPGSARGARAPGARCTRSGSDVATYIGDEARSSSRSVDRRGQPARGQGDARSRRRASAGDVGADEDRVARARRHAPSRRATSSCASIRAIREKRCATARPTSTSADARACARRRSSRRAASPTARPTPISRPTSSSSRSSSRRRTRRSSRATRSSSREIDENLASAKQDHAEQAKQIERQLLAARTPRVIAVEQAEGAARDRSREQGRSSSMEVSAPHDGIFVLERDWRGALPQARRSAVARARRSPRSRCSTRWRPRSTCSRSTAAGSPRSSPPRSSSRRSPSMRSTGKIRLVDKLAKPRQHGSPVQYFAVTIALDTTDRDVMKPGPARARRRSCSIRRTRSSCRARRCSTRTARRSSTGRRRPRLRAGRGRARRRDRRAASSIKKGLARRRRDRAARSDARPLDDELGSGSAANGVARSEAPPRRVRDRARQPRRAQAAHDADDARHDVRRRRGDRDAVDRRRRREASARADRRARHAQRRGPREDVQAGGAPGDPQEVDRPVAARHRGDRGGGARRRVRRAARSRSSRTRSSPRARRPRRQVYGVGHRHRDVTPFALAEGRFLDARRRDAPRAGLRDRRRACGATCSAPTRRSARTSRSTTCGARSSACSRPRPTASAHVQGVAVVVDRARDLTCRSRPRCASSTTIR